MPTMLRLLATTTLAAVIGIGCAAEEGAVVAGTEPTLSPRLESCGLPRPCSWPIASGQEADGPRCVLSELRDGRSLAVETKLVADGAPGECEVFQELYFFLESKVAFQVWRKKCGLDEERSTKRCTTLSQVHYAACLGAFDESRAAKRPTGIECSLPSDWMRDCTEVDTPTCP